MVNNKYIRAVNEIDVSSETLNRVLYTLRHEEAYPTVNPKPKMKRYKKVLLIAAAIIILLNIGMATASAIMGVNLYEEVYRFFDVSIDPKYVESYDGVESTSGNIHVKVTDAISDGYNVMVRLDITDPNQRKITSANDYIMTFVGIGGADLYDEFGNHYEMASGSGSGLGFDEEQGMVLYFEGSPEFSCEMHLFIKKINGTDGDWDMKFTVNPYLDAKKYACETVFEFENGTKIKIDTVEQYLTCTLIKGTYPEIPDFNKENGTVSDAKLYDGDVSYGIHSIESTGHDLEIKFEAIEYSLTQPELKLTLGNGLTEWMKLDLTEKKMKQ